MSTTFKIGDFVKYHTPRVEHRRIEPVNWERCNGCVGIIISVELTDRKKYTCIDTITFDTLYKYSYRIKWIQYTPHMDKELINLFDTGEEDDIFMNSVLIPYRG